MARNNLGMLLAGAAAALLALAMVRPAAAADPIPLTACPYRQGYSAMADFAVTITDETPVEYYDTMAEAEAACNSQPDCKHFNNYAEVYASLEVTFKRTDGVCAYMKLECPIFAGYQALPKGLTWDTSDAASVDGVQSSIQVTSSPQEYCASQPNCVAWNSDGWVALAESFGALTTRLTDAPVCTYVTDACPFKFGFASYPGKSLVAGVGFEGVNSGNFGSGDKAEAFCQITPKCTALSSNGDYTMGAFTNLKSSGGKVKCTYVKDPCPPIRGFTAYDGVSNKHGAGADFPPDAHFPGLCFAELAKSCSTNPDCNVFDLLRYQWNSDVIHFNRFPGMCTYRKASGFFDTAGAWAARHRRRQALDAAGAAAAVEAPTEGEATSSPSTHWVLYYIHYTNPATHPLDA